MSVHPGVIIKTKQSYPNVHILSIVKAPGSLCNGATFYRVALEYPSAKQGGKHVRFTGIVHGDITPLAIPIACQRCNRDDARQSNRGCD
jgi:hypothetical protein